MIAQQILARAQAAGVAVEAIGDKLVYKPKEAAPAELIEEFRQHKSELLACLRARGRETSLFDLPFPFGYGGLPKAQVELAEVVNDKFRITDPVHRKYNVLAWVIGHYQDRGENHGEWYESIKREQQRLGKILDEGSS